MSVFKRSPEANNSFEQIFTKMAWGGMFLNTTTLFSYYWEIYKTVSIVPRVAGSIVMSALILGVEFATLTVLFEPSALEDLLSGLKEGNNQFTKANTTIGLILVCLLSASVFYYDYTINMAQFRIKTVTFDFQLLAAVLVIITEIFFWIANICRIAGGNKKKGGFS